MDTLLQDLRYALRSLGKSPGFALITILTLALGIGANTAMFSVVNAVLLRALPFREPERLMMLWEHRLDKKELHNVVSAANFLAWQDQARSYAGMAAFVDQRPILSGDGSESQSVEARYASGSIFSVLGVTPAVGRLFTADDSRADAANVALLSHQLWQTRFGGRLDAIGKTIQLGGRPAVIAGVLPRDFQFFEKADVWANMQWTAKDRDGSGRYLRVIARLEPGVTEAAAAAELATIARRQAEVLPEHDTNWTANVTSLQETPGGRCAPRAARAARRRRVPARDRVHQRGQPAARPRDLAPARDGDPRVDRRDARPPRTADVDGESRAERDRRRVGSPDRVLGHGRAGGAHSLGLAGAAPE